jgi:hypothetical protein
MIFWMVNYDNNCKVSMKKIKILIIFLALITFIKPQVWADATSPLNQTSLGLDPAIIEAVLDKDSPTEKSIILTNLTGLPIPIKTIQEGFSSKEKLDVPKDKLNIFDASSWISLADKDKDFILQPREIRRIKLIITQPTDASPGGHYATIVFQPLIPQEIINDQSIFVYARVAALIFLQVRGDINEELQITKTSINSIYENTPLNIGISLKNLGNTHLIPQGKIVFTDEFRNQVVATIDLPRSVVLPELEKAYELQFVNDYKFGRISSQTFITYGTSNIQIKTDKIYFYIIPYKFIIVWMLLLGFLYLIAFRFRKRVKKAARILFLNKEQEQVKPYRTLNIKPLKRVDNA